MKKEDIINQLVAVRLQAENLKHQEVALMQRLTVVGSESPVVLHDHPAVTRNVVTRRRKPAPRSFAARKRMSDAQKKRWDNASAEYRRAHGKRLAEARLRKITRRSEAQKKRWAEKPLEVRKAHSRLMLEGRRRKAAMQHA